MTKRTKHVKRNIMPSSPIQPLPLYHCEPATNQKTTVVTNDY